MTTRNLFGTLALETISVLERSFDRNVGRISQSPDGQRDNEVGVNKFVYSSFHTGGLSPEVDLGNWARDGDKYRLTQGLITHIPFGLYLPYNILLDRLTTANSTGYIAANKRAHAINSAIGGGVMRWYCGVGLNIIRDISSSNPALEDSGCATIPASTVKIASIAELVLNSTNYLAFGMAGTTGGAAGDPLCITANPTASPPVLTVYDDQIQLGDIWGMAYVPHLRFNYFYAADVTGGQASMYAVNDSSGLGTALTDLVTPIPGGGYCIGAAPFSPADIYVVAPWPASQATTVSLPRRLIKVSVTNAPAAAITYPNTETTSIGGACYHLGGVLYACEPDASGAGLFTSVKLLSSNGTVRDLGVPTANGSNPIGVSFVESRGRYAIAHCNYLDLTDSIDLVWNPDTGAWSALSALTSFSVAEAMSTATISFAETAISAQNYRYRVRVDTVTPTTSILPHRIFTPANLADNPLVTNTTVGKQYGSMYVETVELDMGGPVESNKVLLAQQYGGRFASAVGGAYGTVILRTSTDGGATFTAHAVNTFDTAFEAYDIPSGGIKIQSARQRIELVNAGTSVSPSAKTPNGLPLIQTISVSWSLLSEWVLKLDGPETLRNNNAENFHDFKAKVLALQQSKAVQPFKIDGYSYNANLVSFEGQYHDTEQGGITVVVRETLGTV